MKKASKYTPKRDPLSNRKKTGSFKNDRSNHFPPSSPNKPHEPFKTTRRPQGQITKYP